MQGSLGIGGNLVKYSAEDLEICKKNIDFYKSVRNIVQFGNLYRILDIEDGEVLCNEYVSTDKNESVVFIAANATRFLKRNLIFTLQALMKIKHILFPSMATNM